MKKSFLTCPGCNDSIIKSCNDEVKLRAKILKWNQDGMFAICKACGLEVPIEAEILRSIQGTFQYVIENKPCSGS